MDRLAFVTLVCTFLTLLGSFLDHTIRKRDQNKITAKLRRIIFYIDRHNPIDIFHLVCDFYLNYFKNTLSNKLFTFTSLVMIVCISGLLTSLAMNLSWLALVWDTSSVQYLIRPTIAIIISILVTIYFLSTDYESKRTISYAMAFGFVLLSFIATIDYFFDLRLSHPLNEEPVKFVIIKSITIGSINFIFDFLTILVTFKAIGIMRNANMVKSLIIIFIDLTVAFILAIFSAYFMGITNLYPQYNYSYNEVFFAFMDLYLRSNFNVDYSNAIFFGSSTLLLTFSYMLIIVSAIMLKPIIRTLKVLGLYAAKAQLEKEEPKIFTVIGAFISLWLLLIQIIIELNK